MKIVYLIESPFNQRDYDRFGIEILEKNGFEVEVWDLTPFIHPEVHQHVQVPDPIQDSGYRQFLSSQEACVAIATLHGPHFFISIVSYRFDSFEIYRALSKNKSRYGVVGINALPLSNIANPSRNLVAKIAHLTPEKLFRVLFARIPFSSLGVQATNVILAGGKQSILGQSRKYPISRETEILWTHTLDYDIYLREKDTPTLVERNNGVFLDEYLPFHPDYVHSKTNPPVSASEYYPLLCKFFDWLEKTYNVRIVIAAHPRSHYEDHPDYFGGRPVIRGQTVKLVQASSFVITHASTSLNFAALFSKPALFITTNKLQASIEGKYCNEMAKWFGKTPINLDAPLCLNWEKELVVDQSAYARYREAYIKKSGSPEKPCWQIVADYLKQQPNLMLG